MQDHMQGRAFHFWSQELPVTHTMFAQCIYFSDIFISWSHKQVEVVIGFRGKNSLFVPLCLVAGTSNLGSRA